VILTDLIKNITENILTLQNDSGYFPAGNNGPHNDPDTPVRNTSHVLILLSNYYKLTNNKVFIDRIFKAAEYLYSKELRPCGYTFHHRNKKGKDKCNGLIGQAWTFEALIEASRALEDEKYLLLAEKVLLQHPFDYEKGLWQTLEIDGKAMGINRTFNQQLWFAVCSSSIDNINRNSELKNRIKKFIGCLPDNLIVMKNGLIFHSVKNSFYKKEKKKKKIDRKYLTNILRIKAGRIFKDALNEKNDPHNKIYRSVGYHSFNMCGFALLKEQIPKHSFWKSDLIDQAIDYILTPDYKNDLEGNVYGYPYNCPGFEIPYALSILGNLDNDNLVDLSNLWINEQFRRCYNKETKMMDRNTSDSLTLTARTYELCRLPVNILDKINIETY